MNLFGKLHKTQALSEIGNVGRDVVSDYQKHVNDAVKALGKGNFNKFGEIVASEGALIMRNDDVHSACVAFLEKAVAAGKDKKASGFCKTVSGVISKDEGSVLNELVFEASENILTKALEGDKIDSDTVHITIATLERMGYASEAILVPSKVAQDLINSMLETGRSEEINGISKITSCLRDCFINPSFAFEKMKDACVSGLVRAACYSQNEALNGIVTFMQQFEQQERTDALQKAYDLAVNKSLQQGNEQLSENARNAFEKLKKNRSF